MNIDTNTVIEKIYELCGIRVIESIRDSESIVFVSAEIRGTDRYAVATIFGLVAVEWIWFLTQITK